VINLFGSNIPAPNIPWLFELNHRSLKVFFVQLCGCRCVGAMGKARIQKRREKWFSEHWLYFKSKLTW
jgi:hypothetical protein